MAQAKNGILLIDEIDSGLHHTVMERMWKMILETAKKLNIQVFATTHSRDCVESLAEICKLDSNDDIALFRIEKEKNKAVAYDEGRIQAAAKHQMEVR